jgi:hypothetical protein
MAGNRAGKTVYLHVGAPTTGTSFIQQALWDNRRGLGDVGICYPLANKNDHFGAVMDLREMAWGGHRDPAWDGAWARMAERAGGDPDAHTVIFSQGLLGGANEQQVKRAVAALEPAEVHVVFVTRDLRWQLIADWQEQIRHAHSITFERFVDDLVELGIKAPKPYGEMFWGLHDPVRVLGTWETAVPKERIHVITAPGPGEGSSEGHGSDPLWTRFCAVTGIDPECYDVSAIPPDEPLPVIEAELLRRLNDKIAPMLGDDYKRVVREYILGRRDTGAPPTGWPPMGLPSRHAAWAAERTRELTASLRASGYDVVGDLEELTTPADPGPVALPDAVPDRLIVNASVGVIGHLLEELTMAHERIGLAHLHSELSDVRRNLDQLLEAASAPPPSLQRAARRAAARRPW